MHTYKIRFTLDGHEIYTAILEGFTPDQCQQYLIAMDLRGWCVLSCDLVQ